MWKWFLMLSQSDTDSTAVWPPYRAQSRASLLWESHVESVVVVAVNWGITHIPDVMLVMLMCWAVDSCLCCSVPTDQITFIQDVGQMSLRRFSSRYHTLSFTVKQHRMSLLSLHSCRRAGRTGVIGLRVGWLFSFTSCLVLVAVLSFVSWNMSVGWTWCACFISSVCVAPAGWGHHNCDQTEEQMFLLF